MLQQIMMLPGILWLSALSVLSEWLDALSFMICESTIGLSLYSLEVNIDFCVHAGLMICYGAEIDF